MKVANQERSIFAYSKPPMSKVFSRLNDPMLHSKCGFLLWTLEIILGLQNLGRSENFAFFRKRVRVEYREELQVERVTSWEDEVAREEEEETKQRRPEEIQEPEPVQNEPEERIRTPEPEKRQPTSRPNPWGRKLDTEPKKEPPIVSTYASVSKGKERTPPPSPPPVSATAPQPTPKGVWGGKNPRVKAYSQVAASNANTAQSTQPETKSGKVGMVTMSLPTRTVSRN